MRSFLRLAIGVLIMLAMSMPMHAHSMFQSSILLDYHRSGVDMELQVPLSRLEQALGHPLAEGSLIQPAFRSYLLERIHVHAPGGQPWQVNMQQDPMLQIIDGAPYVVSMFRLNAPAEAPTRRMLLEDDVVTDTVPSHVVLVSIRSDWQTATFASDPELLDVLSSSSRSLEIDRGTGNWMRGFRSIFHLGVKHIAEGTDHLLFLLALLLPAPLLVHWHRWAGPASVRQALSRIVQVVTAFTIGHSFTLALAISGVVHVPSQPVEVLIAVSILFSALHAIRPLFPGREAFIAGAFGLIHGLAFASTLAELGLHRWERAESLIAFNLGIESMQLLVVLCIMPSLLLLSRTPLYASFRITGAVGAEAAASGWIVERISHRGFGVDRVVDVLAAHGFALACCLAMISITTFSLQKDRQHAVSPP